MSVFQKLISIVPEGAKVLDVGCGGLSGENTTRFLIERFGETNITGIVRPTAEALDFFKEHPNINMNFISWPVDYLPGEFDLVVLDLNIDTNILNDWTEEGMEEVGRFIRPGGYLINYVMMTDQYGDKETPALIREHWQEWWNDSRFSQEAVGRKLSKLDGWELIAGDREDRREYILWVLLKKTSGQ